MQIVIAGIVVAFLASLNLWATWKVLQDRLSTPGQLAAQAAIVWLLPIIGGLLVIRLKSDHLESPSGRYREDADPGDDSGLSGQPDWQPASDAVESASASSDA